MSSNGSWLRNEDILGHGEDAEGRPISPAPIIEGDIETAEQITVVFPDDEDPVTMSRRDFMRLSSTAAAAGALVATAGCQIPTEHIAPLANRPPGHQPGEALFFNSTSGQGAGSPIRIRSRAGRPIHIEGNGEHPLSGGGITARDGAAILDLYDPDRAKEPAQVEAGKAKDTDYGTLDGAVAQALDANQGKVVFLTSAQNGVATLEAIEELCATFGGRHLQFQAAGNTALLDAAEACYGLRKAPDYKLDGARSIVGFGAEFLDTFMDPARFQADWSAGRDVDEHGTAMARTTIFESRLTVTGANADRRHRVVPRHQKDVALAIARIIAQKSARNDLAESKSLKAFTVEAVAAVAGIAPEAITTAADHLIAHRGASLAIAGGVGSSKDLEIAVNLINDLLGNTGKTVLPGANHQVIDGLQVLNGLTKEMDAGNVGALVILGANPVLAGASSSFKKSGVAVTFAQALAKVDTVIVANDRLDETGLKANWFAPLSHPLESWGDSNAVRGVHSLRQPAITPLYNSRSLLDHLIAWGSIPRGGKDKVNVGGRVLSAAMAAQKNPGAPASYHYLRDVWNHRFLRQATGTGLDRAFAEVLRAGFHGQDEPAATAPMQMDALKNVQESIAEADGGGSIELMLVPTVALGDGTGPEANNGWLQELADPISKVVWDNCLAVSMKDAREQLGGVTDGDLIKVVTDTGDVVVPVLIQPGMAPGAASLAIGYGRSAAGAVGNEVGKDAYALAGSTGALVVSANLGRADGHHKLAKIQDESFLNNTLRPLAPEGTLAQWKALKDGSGKKATDDHGKDDHGKDGHGKDDHGHGDHGGGHHALPTHWYVHDKVGYESHGDHKIFKGGLPGPSLWKGHKYTSYRWAMTIDTNSCTGCSSCVIACQSENNVPVVGRMGVLSNREMNWLRIDRYYAFDTQADNPGAEAKYQKWDHLKDKPADAWDNPKTHVQPMLCQHCENAGCETVCPFTATMHDDEGVNQQVYNRCVGTRYCANNCAYKVRRYNWFEYGFNRQNWLADMVNKEGPKQQRYNQVEPLPMRFNPEVTVRTRGVMEKCSFCTQRISAAKQVAESEGRRVGDADLQTACQAVCPSNAISFGDINNPESAVAQGVQDTRSYRLLEEVGAKPSVFYMARIWNV